MVFPVFAYFFFAILVFHVNSDPVTGTLTYTRTPGTIIQVSDPPGSQATKDWDAVGLCTPTKLHTAYDNDNCTVYLGSKNPTCSSPNPDPASYAEIQPRFSEDIGFSNFQFDSVIDGEPPVPTFGFTVDTVVATLWKSGKTWNLDTSFQTPTVINDIWYEGSNKIFDTKIILSVGGQNSSNNNILAFVASEPDRVPAPTDNVPIPYPIFSNSSWDMDPAIFTTTNIRDSSFGLYHAVAVGMACNAGDFRDEREPFNRRYYLDKVSLTVTGTLSWSVTSMFPVNGSSSSTNDTTIVTGTGFSDTGASKCRWSFSGGDIVQTSGTVLNSTHLECDVATNFGLTGTSDLSISLNNGTTWSTTPLTYTYLVPCNPECVSPAAGTCNNVTGVCSCSVGYYGAGCVGNCSDTTPPQSCSICSVKSPSSCPFCTTEMHCGPCGSAGVEIDFLSKTCPDVISVQPIENPSNLEQTLTITGINLQSGVDIKCNWKTTSSNTIVTDISFVSNGTLTCTMPRLENLDVDTIENVLLTITHLGYPYVPFSLGIVFGTLGQADQSDSSTLETGELAAVIAAAVAFGVFSFCGAFTSYARYKKRLLDDKFRALFAPPVFCLDSAFNKFYFLASADRNTFLQDKDQWFYFEELLTRPGFFILDAFFSSLENSQIPFSDKEDLHKAVLYIFESNGLTFPLLSHYVDKHVSECETGQTLFRGANPASKMYSAYVRTQPGLDYLCSTLVHVLYDVCTQFAKQGTELNPEMVSENQSVVVNKYHLMSACQKIFESIVESGESLPPLMRLLFVYIRSSVSVRFPEYSLKIIGSFIYLRFFCPVIASPVTYGLLKEDPEDNARRLLVLVSKTLMNLANGVKFGVKEEYMQVMNDLIETNLAQNDEFYLSISSPHVDSDEDTDSEGDESTAVWNDSLLDEFDITPQILPEDVKEVSLALLHHYFLDSHELLQKTLERTLGTVDKSGKTIDQETIDSAKSLIAQVLDVLSSKITIDEEEEDVF